MTHDDTKFLVVSETLGLTKVAISVSTSAISTGFCRKLHQIAQEKVIKSLRDSLCLIRSTTLTHQLHKYFCKEFFSENKQSEKYRLFQSSPLRGVLSVAADRMWQTVTARQLMCGYIKAMFVSVKNVPISGWRFVMEQNEND